MEDTKIITMPVIALRGLTMLPEMTISFDISRQEIHCGCREGHGQ